MKHRSHCKRFSLPEDKGSKTAVNEALNVEFWSLVHATPKNGVANVTGRLLYLVNDSFERDKLTDIYDNLPRTLDKSVL